MNDSELIVDRPPAGDKQTGPAESPADRGRRMRRRVTWLCVILGLVTVGVLAERQRRSSNHRQRLFREIERVGGFAELEHYRPAWVRRLIGDEASQRHLDAVVHIDLSGTRAGDETMQRLTGLTRLRRLALNQQIGNDGLVHLDQLPGLRFLAVGGPNVTDSGLRHLHGLAGLQLLYLDVTQVTSEGIRALQQALPDLKVERSPWLVLPDEVAEPRPFDGPSEPSTGENSPRTDFVGAVACRSCHAERFESFRHTGHHLTSSLPTAANLGPKFRKPVDRVRTISSELHFEIESRGEAFYQTAVLERDGTRKTHSERIDILIGSGGSGQSYLYWKGEHLFQLPISYLAQAGTWRNSPGMPDGQAMFRRPIDARCLECHATWFESLPESDHRYRRDQVILGISCERCHGPGRAHVAYHQAHPAETAAQRITHPGKLPTQRRIDICNQCHSGAGQSLRPPFSYRVGERLADYLRFDDSPEWVASTVHAPDQFGRLKQSRCFQRGQEMTCTSCHDPHQNERGQPALFSQRCLKCHEVHDCGMAPRLGKDIATNCIDCHMPLRRDEGTLLTTGGHRESPLFRDHHVAIYAKLAEQILRRKSP